MYESQSDGTHIFATLLARAKQITATIKLMRGSGEFGSQEMYDFQTELSEIFAELAWVVSRENKMEFSRPAVPGIKALQVYL